MAARRVFEKEPPLAAIFGDRAYRVRYRRGAAWRDGLTAFLAELHADARGAEAAGRDAEAQVLDSMHRELARPLTD